MRVLMVTPGFYPIKGGSETIVRSLATGLNKIGVCTDVMTFNQDQKFRPKWRAKMEKIDGITVFKIPGINLLPRGHTSRITLGVHLVPGRFTHLLKQYNIIHFHEAEFSFPLFSCLVQKPKILHLHALDVNFYKRYFLSRLILKHIADSYICLTKLMERELVELGLSKDKIRVLPNGVDVKIFRPSGVKKDNLVLFVGRISFQKGLHILLKSLRYLEKSIHLVIIGPPDWDLSYFNSILMSIEEINKKGKHKVTYLGAQDQTSIVEWYRKACILVLPSLGEALSVVILEASSCETPIVASNVGGIPEVIRDGENGILVPPNAVKLANAMQYLLDNEEVRRKLGREGRKKIIEHFSLEATVGKLCRIYKEMLDDCQPHSY